MPERVPMHPIVIVTGGNTGVGFGICQRLLVQYSSSDPSDFHLGLAEGKEKAIWEPITQFTLVIACRTVARGEAAKRKLLQFLDDHIQQRKANENYDGHEEIFRKGLTIDVVQVDLSSTEATFKFCDVIKQKYSYVSHLILNAGTIPYNGINWPLAIWWIVTDPVTAFSFAPYKIQEKGKMSEDGLGWTWQCNVFGHYMVAQELDDHLRKTPSQAARVLWMSSFEAEPKWFQNTDDWQLIDTDKSYEGTKYQIDLIGTQLHTRRQSDNDPHHLVTHPAIAPSDMVVEKTWFPGFFRWLMMVSFVLARAFGSMVHPVTTFLAAISATHAAIVAPAFLPSSTSSVKFGSRATAGTRPYIEYDPIHGWAEHQGDATKLVAKCEALYLSDLAID